MKNLGAIAQLALIAVIGFVVYKAVKAAPDFAAGAADGAADFESHLETMTSPIRQAGESLGNSIYEYFYGPEDVTPLGTAGGSGIGSGLRR